MKERARATLRLDPDPTSLPRARLFVADTLRSWHAVDREIGDAILVANELVANAIVHARTDAVLVLERAGTDLVLKVADSATSVPTFREAAGEETGGRGLIVLTTLATDWGIEPASDGKAVWARFARAFDS